MSLNTKQHWLLKTAKDTNRVHVFIGVEIATVNLHRQKLANVLYHKATKTHNTLPLFAAQHSGISHTHTHARTHTHYQLYEYCWKLRHTVITKLNTLTTAVKHRISLKPGFHYPSWRPELTGDRFPLPVNTGRVDGRAFPLAELTAPSTRAVN